MTRVSVYSGALVAFVACTSNMFPIVVGLDLLRPKAIMTSSSTARRPTPLQQLANIRLL